MTKLSPLNRALFAGLATLVVAAAFLEHPGSSLASATQPQSATSVEGAGTGSPPPLRAIILAGGPDAESNQVSIENNAIFVQRCLPKGTQTRILFAGGNPKARNVQSLSPTGRTNYVAAKISPVNGPTSVAALWHELALAVRGAAEHSPQADNGKPTASGGGPSLGSAESASAPPLLLYFGGHGSPGADNTYANTQYALWNDRALTVRRLAAGIKALPAQQSVVVVMAQCFSGGFGNLIFEDGDPGGTAVSRNLAGFFASLPQREAWGCTPEVDQTGYTDFTGYFFAALSGRDRQGRAVTGADYNHDGIVGMDEALAYARIHDDSIDTPMCTSDTFLRRFVPMPTKLIVSTAYSELAAWATPAQKATLDALSAALHLTTQNRLARAYQRYRVIDADTEDIADVKTIRFVFTAKTVVQQHQLEKYGTPALKARYAALQASEAVNPLRPALNRVEPTMAGPAVSSPVQPS